MVTGLKDPVSVMIMNILPGCNYAISLKLFLEDLVSHEEIKGIWN